MNWLKKILIEKWLGRLLTLGVAALGGVFVGMGVDQGISATWVSATTDLVSALLPIVIAIVMQWIQHRVALAKMPPVPLPEIKNL